MVLFGGPTNEPHVLTHHTTRHTIKSPEYVSIPTYETSPIIIQSGTDVLEIQGLTQKEIQQAILSYVRGQGYSSSDASQQSGFLSDLADLLPDVTKRVADEMERQAQR